jgi:radical SAM-linked protein
MAIGDLTLKTLRAGREINDRARVHIGVSTFVPKPFTPFQWAEQIDVEETWRRQNMLSDKFAKSNGVKFGRHNAKETFLEGLVSRTDRRTADLIEAAFRLGARFDAWSEHMDFRAWQIAIEETNFDVKDALRARDLDERLPWDHIDVMIPKTWFQEDWRRAEALEHAPDCRHSQCHRCGVIDVERDLCAHMLRNAIDGAKDEGHWTPKSKKKAIDPLSSAATTAPLGMRMTSKPLKEREPDPSPIQRLRFRISRIGDVRYLSHLELAAAWIRALRRANAPLAYSQGFHQHPKVTFSTASPVGEESTGDFMDVVLSQTVDPEALFDKLISALPDGLGSLSVTEVPLRSPSLMSLVEGFTYTLTSKHANSEEVRSRIAAILSSEEVIVERKKPRKGRRPPRSRHINIRPMIAQLALREGREVEVDFTTCRNDDRLAKWREVAELIGMDPLKVRVLKHSTTLAAVVPPVVPAVVPAVIAKGSEHV